MSVQPTALRIDEAGDLEIAWSDGATTTCAVSALRDHCPCATCREKRRGEKPEPELPILAPGELRPLTIEKMRPMGAYAYSIEFSDGHNTGIFEFDLLRAIASL